MKTAHFAAILCLFLLNASFQKSGGRAVADARNGQPKLPVPEKWLETEIQRGDNLSLLLRRYGLSDYDCNAQKFLELNGLKSADKLIAGKTYKMPVAIVKYNGKSIRTTLKTNDLELALRVEAFNKAALAKRLRSDDFIKSRNLWVAWHELGCPAEGEEKEAETEKARQPAPAAETEIGDEKSYLGDRVFPIFGPKYQKTPLESRRLKGRVFYIVSGHGGPDVGAEGKRGGHTLCEDEYAYDVSLRLLRLLVSHGATAYMIVRDPDDGIRDEEFLQGDKDEKVWGNRTIPLNQEKRLAQRCELLNQLTKNYLAKGITDQTLIEIHVDSRSRHHRTDVFFYHRRDSEPSEKLARRMHETFRQKYLKVRAQKEYSGTVGPRDLYMLRQTTVPTAVYIELGNIRNDHDQQRLVLVKNRQALAKWLGEALMGAPH